ncbi:MAG: hypothetical protein ACLTDF_02080 [Coprococcus sp.]
MYDHVEGRVASVREDGKLNLSCKPIRCRSGMQR